MAGAMGLMDLSRDYLSKMLARVSGLKVLLVDSETKSCVSTVFTQSEILKEEVFLVERIDNEESEKLLHMKAVCLLRPSYGNLRMLCRHLREPRFSEYHLFFTNTCKDSYLQDLAQADEQEVVRQVQEYYCDYLVLDKCLFSVPSVAGGRRPPNAFIRPDRVDTQELIQEVDRTVESIAALLLSLKTRKPLIVYQKSSKCAHQIAENLHRLVYYQCQSLFATERGSSAPVVLIMDRCNDPVTPLLTQWTYQAMVHELIGVSNNRVDLSSAATNVSQEQKQIVLSSFQDSFFRKQMFNNYGDLGMEIKNLVDGFQDESRMNHNIQSIEDMQRFVENYPEFRSRQGNVSKHVALVTELSKIVEERQLMSLSELEQDIACNASSAASCSEEVLHYLRQPSVKSEDKLRLAMLFSLRFEQDRDLRQRLASELRGSGVPDGSAAVEALLSYGGQAKRSGDLFGGKTLLARANKAVKGLKGVENVYTQHQPLVGSLVDQILKSKLNSAQFPMLPATGVELDGRSVKDLIVFIAGGATYEESMCIDALNAQLPGVNVYLGGSSMVNSRAFMDALKQ